MHERFIVKLAAGTVAAAVAVLASAGPAYAGDRRSGYQECNANRFVAVSSTTKNGRDFHVSHEVNGSGRTWTEPGYHSWVSPHAGGHWSIYTTSAFESGGAGCA